MGAHALGAAAYAAKAAGLAAPDRRGAVEDEIRWQFDHMSPATRVPLRELPRVGEDSSGPLGPRRLAGGLLGTIIRRLQSSLMDLDKARPSQTSDDASGPASFRSGDPAGDER
jgi:hypothetical protein